jgi:AAA domain
VSAQRVVIYGPGGIGKTELCANIKQIAGMRPLFVDIGTGSSFLDVDRVEPAPQTWEELRGALHEQSLWKDHNAVVVDDLTTAENLAVRWTLANVMAERAGGSSAQVNSIEGYGWGKGYTHVYETFLQLLGDLDAHVRAGRTVLCIAHDCTAKVPNPAGIDYIRYEPRLQNTDKGNIRSRVKEWADHLLFIGYDVFSRDGKAQGSGTRTIYPNETPTQLAKSRSLESPIVYERGSAELWKQLLKPQGA